MMRCRRERRLTAGMAVIPFPSMLAEPAATTVVFQGGYANEVRGGQFGSVAVTFSV
jgi:hypothetical protein